MTSLARAEIKLGNNSKIMSKWCINMIAVLMLQAGGQRPQVFWQLQFPSDEDFHILRTISNDKQYIPLRTQVEKFSGDPRFPGVILPPMVFPYI